MVKERNIAINVNEINKLMLDIIECANNVRIIFNKINDLVMETKSYYECVSATTLRNKYSQFSDNYSRIISSIKSYNTDLSNLKKKYAVNMEDLSYQISRDASNIDHPLEYKEGR
jgi:hypothetical protein